MCCFLSSNFLSKLWRFFSAQRHSCQTKTLRTLGFELISLSEAIFNFYICFSILKVGCFESGLEFFDSHLLKPPHSFSSRSRLRLDFRCTRSVCASVKFLRFEPPREFATPVNTLPTLAINRPPDNCLADYRWATFGRFIWQALRSEGES